MLLVLPLIALLGVIVIEGYVQLHKTMQRDRARMLGNRLVMYNNAVRAYLAHDGLSVATGTKTGVAWLKDAGCGGTASQRYLDCGFTQPLPFGLTLSTVVTNHGTWVGAVTTLGPIVDSSGSPRVDLGGLAVLTANGGHTSSQSPLTATYYGYSLLTSGAIQASATTAPSLDAWLRTDGSNQMKADLDVGGHNIVNAGTVNASSFVDKDNPTYKIDPNGSSTVNNLVVTGDIYLPSLGRYLSEAVLYQTVAGDGALVNKPICPHGVPFPTLAVERVNENGVANPIGSIEPFFTDYSATQWQVHFRIMTKDGYVTVYAPWARVQVSIKCQV